MRTKEMEERKAFLLSMELLQLYVLAAFELDSTGTILLQDQLDYENTTSYQVRSDGYTTATTQVAMTVLPVNDNAPTFI